MEKQPAGSPDACLLPLLQAQGEADRERHLTGLMSDAEPVIRGILRRKGFSSTRSLIDGSSQDEQTAEDLRGEVIVRLLTRLQDLQADPIGNFHSFVATTTYHVYDDYLREKYPQRSSLKKKLVYLLSGRTSQHGFALWETDRGRRLCGFAAWQGQPAGERRTREYDQLLDDPHRFAARALPRDPISHINPAEWLAALFNAVQCPLELNELVQVVAELWGVKDAPIPIQPREGEDGSDPVQEQADPQANVETEVEQRDHLLRLWAEIRQLPPRQCAALLLNLRDVRGCGVIELLEIRGITSLREIAAALDMPAEQFAGLLNELPIDDAAIAARLGCTRQQVINLRKVARERLERRMKKGEG